jgi:predicted DNA-binding transcriptional regulator AlpA
MIANDRTTGTEAARYLNAEEAAKFLGYTGNEPYRAIYRQQKFNGFPRGVRIGRRLQWRERDVLAWREARAERVLGGVK